MINKNEKMLLHKSLIHRSRFGFKYSPWKANPHCIGCSDLARHFNPVLPYTFLSFIIFSSFYLYINLLLFTRCSIFVSLLLRKKLSVRRSFSLSSKHALLHFLLLKHFTLITSSLPPSRCVALSLSRLTDGFLEWLRRL